MAMSGWELPDAAGEMWQFLPAEVLSREPGKSQWT